MIHQVAGNYILPDRDGTEDGIITWGTNPAGISVSMSPFGAGVSGGDEAKAPAYAIGDPGDFITTAPNLTGEFRTDVTSTWWGFDIWNDAATASSTPVSLPLMIVSGFILLVASLTSSWMMRRFGSGGHFAKTAIIFGAMGICVAVGMYDWWMLVIFAVLAIALS